MLLWKLSENQNNSVMELFAPPFYGHQHSGHSEFMNDQHQLYLSTVVNTDVIIGNLSVNCKGNGICKMLPSGSFSAHCSAVKSTLVKRLGHRLDIVFYPQESCPKLRQRVFTQADFIMEEPFPLPKWVRTALSFGGQARIPAGSYPMLLLKECAFVSFKLHGDSAET